MKTVSPLQVVTLAHLSRSQNERVTPYEIMTEINQIFALIDTPYSPGAFYPAIKNLSKNKMININQSGCRIEPAGTAYLETVLLHHPLPGSLTGILYRVIAANISANSKLRTEAIKRIDIELIKFDQIESTTSSNKGQHNQALSIVRQDIANCIRRLILNLRGKK